MLVFLPHSLFKVHDWVGHREGRNLLLGIIHVVGDGIETWLVGAGVSSSWAAV